MDSSLSSATASNQSSQTSANSANSSSSSSSDTASGGGGGATPFGGMSTYAFYCTCSAGIAHTINDLTKQTGVSMPLVYQVGETQLYPYGQVFSSGVWLLGLWQSGGECEYYVGKGCSSYTVEGVMTMVGTSM